MAEKPIDAFRVSVNQDSPIYGEYDAYRDIRRAFSEALKELNEATEYLKEVVGPMLPQDRLAMGNWWKLREDPTCDALVIEVYADKPKRGKQKAELPFEELNLPE
jgi:hypothetical protein